MTIDLQQCQENFKQRAAARQFAREARRQQVREVAIAAILQVLRHYPDITQVYLFGSIIQPGRFHSHSDIDIAVAGSDAATYFALWRDLEAACPNWFIDLREINQPSCFADTVRQFGELIYESSSRTAQSQH
jgi:predicted nucleotidyltransferase